MNGLDAAEKIQLGVSLVQFYSGFIYRGPELISECVTEIDNAARMAGKLR
jgi:dihydroorotate dehydrogenase